MSEMSEIDLIAAEYALGTLDATERQTMAARAAREPAVARAIADWSRRFAPLLAYCAPATPSPAVQTEINRRLDAMAVDLVPSKVSKSTIHVLDQSRRRWRSAAVSLGALAAALVGVIAIREAMVHGAPTTFVAVLQKDAASPAFLLTVDTTSRNLTVRPVSAPAEPGKSYELWLVHDSLKQPRSLGLLSDKAPLVNASVRGFGASVVRDATYAVSLEPAGGSKTGVPTGPVVYAGKLIEATP